MKQLTEEQKRDKKAGREACVILAVGSLIIAAIIHFLHTAGFSGGLQF